MSREKQQVSKVGNTMTGRSFGSGGGYQGYGSSRGTSSSYEGRNSNRYMQFQTTGTGFPSYGSSGHQVIGMVIAMAWVLVELQLKKRSLACRLSSMESKLAAPAEVSESDIVAR
ncbi:hypothetical protein POM88_035799 [Heracleum sosnowskyi]|uniref:Uncharacterized protein n=1 Tax=Heracleum sosnowskyi TaxID=360622 RepID=A0AAD8ME97_9APIA|nr:hypothetical protein POM88_035799 [Heracleum sosnowskyi]